MTCKHTSQKLCRFRLRRLYGKGKLFEWNRNQAEEKRKGFQVQQQAPVRSGETLEFQRKVYHREKFEATNRTIEEHFEGRFFKNFENLDFRNSKQIVYKESFVIASEMFFTMKPSEE